MINVLIGIFYVALIALVSYLLYYLIKTAIKDAYYELDLNKTLTYENTNFNEPNDEMLKDW